MRLLPALQVPENERRALYEMTLVGNPRMKLRAHIVLMAMKGVPNRRIAAAVGMNQNQVGLWRKRYAVLGISGLRDRPRPGRPRRRQSDGRIAGSTDEP